MCGTTVFYARVWGDNSWRALVTTWLGESIEAQSHDNVTMLFSDLVGFTAICATATPMEIISLLQSLYTQFDVLCGDLDIYKVTYGQRIE